MQKMAETLDSPFIVHTEVNGNHSLWELTEVEIYQQDSAVSPFWDILTSNCIVLLSLWKTFSCINSLCAKPG